MEYSKYSDLPNHIRSQIERLNVGAPDQWVTQKMPALGNRSVLTVMNTPQGEDEVVRVLNRIETKFS